MKIKSLIISLGLVLSSNLSAQTTNGTTGSIVVEDNFMPNLFIKVNWFSTEPILINKYMFTTKQIEGLPTIGASVDVVFLMNTQYRRSIYFHITRPYGYRKEKLYLDRNFPSSRTNYGKPLVYFNAELGLGIHVHDEVTQKNKNKYKGKENSEEFRYGESSAFQKNLLRKIFLLKKKEEIIIVKKKYLLLVVMKYINYLLINVQ